MMWNSAPFGRRQLGGADIEMAVHLQRVAVDDFARKFLRHPEREFTFTRPGRADYRNQRSLQRVHVTGAQTVCRQTPLYNEKVNFDPGEAASGMVSSSQPRFGSWSEEVRTA